MRVRHLATSVLIVALAGASAARACDSPNHHHQARTCSGDRCSSDGKVASTSNSATRQD